MPFGGMILSKLGVRPTALIGGWLMSAGVMLSYLTIQSSFHALVITYGLMLGVGIGLAYVTPLVCCMKWFPKQKGLVLGIVLAAYGGGPFIFQQIQTAYINPTNLSPNQSLPQYPDEKYFDSDEVLDKVPSSFLIFGATYAVMQAIGVIFLSEPSQERHQDEKNTSDDTTKLLEKSSEDDNKSDDFIANSTSEKDVRGSGLNLHPKEMVKTRAFWIIWFTFLLNTQGPVFMRSLYKAYGQTFISDDKFLALVGAFSAVAGAGGRIFWGSMADWFSYKAAMLCLCSAFVIFMLTYMATPIGGKSMFFIWTCIIYFQFSGNFALLPTATARSFGMEHVGINYGIVYTANILTGLAGAFLPILLLDILGWNGMFVLMAGFSVIGFILTLLFNVKRPTGENV